MEFICLTYTLNTWVKGKFRHYHLTISFLRWDFHTNIWGFGCSTYKLIYPLDLTDDDIEVSRHLTAAVGIQVRNCLLTTILGGALLVSHLLYPLLLFSNKCFLLHPALTILLSHCLCSIRIQLEK